MKFRTACQEHQRSNQSTTLPKNPKKQKLFLQNNHLKTLHHKQRNLHILNHKNSLS